MLPQLWKLWAPFPKSSTWRGLFQIRRRAISLTTPGSKAYHLDGGMTAYEACSLCTGRHRCGGGRSCTRYAVLGGSGPVAPQIPTPTHTPTLGPPTLGPPTLTPTPLPTGPQPLRSIGIERAFPNLKFGDLTNLVQPDDGLDNMVVTEKSGRILIFPNDDDATRVDMFMDLRDRVSYTPAPLSTRKDCLAWSLTLITGTTGTFTFTIPPPIPDVR